MIAESPATIPLPNASTLPNASPADADSHADATLSLSRIVATLQVVLATRRAARNEEHAYWYNVARGM
jgi:hypothetical protein